MSSPWNRTTGMDADAANRWQLGRRMTLSCRTPLVAGIVNVTPDSFMTAAAIRMRFRAWRTVAHWLPTVRTSWT